MGLMWCWHSWSFAAFLSFGVVLYLVLVFIRYEPVSPYISTVQNLDLIAYTVVPSPGNWKGGSRLTTGQHCQTLLDGSTRLLEA